MTLRERDLQSLHYFLNEYEDPTRYSEWAGIRDEALQVLPLLKMYLNKKLEAVALLDAALAEVDTLLDDLQDAGDNA